VRNPNPRERIAHTATLLAAVKQQQPTAFSSLFGVPPNPKLPLTIQALLLRTAGAILDPLYPDSLLDRLCGCRIE
jgi:hypothetical protein